MLQFAFDNMSDQPNQPALPSDPLDSFNQSTLQSGPEKPDYLQDEDSGLGFSPRSDFSDEQTVERDTESITLKQPENLEKNSNTEVVQSLKNTSATLPILKRSSHIIRRYILCTEKTDNGECNEEFAELFKFQCHQMLEHKKKPYFCQQCDKRFENHGDVGAHRKEQHQIDSTETFYCSKGKCADKHKPFKSYKYLYEHDYLYHRKGKFECNLPNCKDKPFYGEYYGEVKNHQSKAKYHQEKNFKCPQQDCGDKFKTSEDYDFHMLYHASKISDNKTI